MRSLRRIFVVATLIVLFAIALLPARAKGQPDKIILRGSDIGEIEITDPAFLAALELGQLENFGSTVLPPILVGRGYELKRYYRQDDGTFRAFDHAHYYPGMFGLPSYVFYDGLNVDDSSGGSEYDGKWFYATPEGDAAMRALLREIRVQRTNVTF